jgi:hypothetical protein
MFWMILWFWIGWTALAVLPVLVVLTLVLILSMGSESLLVKRFYTFPLLTSLVNSSAFPGFLSPCVWVLGGMQLALWAACVCTCWNLGFGMLNSAELVLSSPLPHYFTNLPPLGRTLVYFDVFVSRDEWDDQVKINQVMIKQIMKIYFSSLGFCLNL